MNTTVLPLVASISFAFLTASLSLAAENDLDRRSSPIFLAAALTDDDTVEVRASHGVTVEIIKAVRDGFNVGVTTAGPVSAVPNISKAYFTGSEIRSQVVLQVRGRTCALHPSSALGFGVVQNIALHLSKIEGIEDVYIVGFGHFAPPSNPAGPDPFAGKSPDPQDPFAE